jgi:protein-S-isoprenylcysteine O-methyltransferase Ste14
MTATPVVAGLEIRLAPSPMDPAWFALGLALFVSGLFLSGWAMSCNPFFEGTVRIQTEEGHYVVGTGPYRAIRHPGYAGLCLWSVASPFLLLSWWACLPALAVVAWTILRTALEDLTLRRELLGYDLFVQRTRHRLVPGVW